jgi:iron complex outermembrane recepter protein
MVGHKARLCFIFVALQSVNLSATTAKAEQSAPPESDPLTIVTVYGSRASTSAVRAQVDAELDEADVAAFGVDSVGELLDDLLSRLDQSEDGPVILVNGKPSNGRMEIGDLPIEALFGVQVLARGAAAQLGQSPTRRVVNVVIKPNHRQITTILAQDNATQGGGEGRSGSLSFVAIADNNRRSLTLKASQSDPLFESERDIDVTPQSGFFDFTGNVVRTPGGQAEIDPRLSLLAGQRVTIAPVPPLLSAPRLADFVARANTPNIGDTRPYRTLIAGQDSVNFAANFTQRLSSSADLCVSIAGESLRNTSTNGPATLSLALPNGSGVSPFSNPVIVNRFLPIGLEQNREVDQVDVSMTLNMQIKAWRLSWASSVAQSWTDTLTARQLIADRLQAEILAGRTSPFGPLDGLSTADLVLDTSRSRATSLTSGVTLSGSPFKMPLGPANLALRVNWRSDVTSSIGSFAGIDRQESAAQATLGLPIFRQQKPGLEGDLNLELILGARDSGYIDATSNWGLALTWSTPRAFRLRLGYSDEQLPPPQAALGAPVLITDSVSIFDFVNNNSVLVRYVSGGNPALELEDRATTSLGFQWRPFVSTDFTLNGELNAQRARNGYGALPPINSGVQNVFQDRFKRDQFGVLIEVDARPVSFARYDKDQLRWGMAFNRTFGRQISNSQISTSSLQAGTRVSLSLNHTWVIANKRLARAGLPEVDLLDGGAIGYGGGVPAHTLSASAGIVRKGVGVQLSAGWRSGSLVRTGSLATPQTLTFGTQSVVDLRLFANLQAIWPRSVLAKNTRLTLSVHNLFDDAQDVVDQSGITPLAYQPARLEPLGRTISMSVRRAF